MCSGRPPTPIGYSFGEDARASGEPRELGHSRPCSSAPNCARQLIKPRILDGRIIRRQRSQATSFPHRYLEDDFYNGYLSLRGMMKARINMETLRCGGQQGDLAASVCRSASTFPPVCTCEPSSRSLNIACVQSPQRCFSSASHLSLTCRLSRLSRAPVVRALCA